MTSDRDLPIEERELLNNLLLRVQEDGSFRQEVIDQAYSPENFAHVIRRQAEVRLSLFEAARPLADYWRQSSTAAPTLVVARERLVSAAAAAGDLDALSEWLNCDVEQCANLCQQILDDPSVLDHETFGKTVQSQIRSGAAPFEALRDAAFAVGRQTMNLVAEQQHQIWREAATQRGIPFTEEVFDDGSRLFTYNTTDRRRPWWQRLTSRDRS